MSRRSSLRIDWRACVSFLFTPYKTYIFDFLRAVVPCDTLDPITIAPLTLLLILRLGGWGDRGNSPLYKMMLWTLPLVVKNLIFSSFCLQLNEQPWSFIRN